MPGSGDSGDGRPGGYVLRRLLQFAPTLIGALFLLHYLTALSIQLNGNPARAVFGDHVPTPEQLDGMARLLGTADPCFTRVGDPCLAVFGTRLGNLVTGDLGTDIHGRDVLILLAEAAPVTVQLALIAFLINAVIGVGAGVLAGLRPGRLADQLVRILTPLLIAVPTFVLASMLQLGLGVELGLWLGQQSWAPAFLGQVFTVAFRPDQSWLSLIIPGTVLGAMSAAVTARVTRAGVLENLATDYVRLATAKGLSRGRVVSVHALRNSLVPVVTNLGADLGAVLGGAVVVEGIFNIPGAGRLTVNAIMEGDAPVVIAVVTVGVLVYLIVNLAVDVGYALLDPRVHHG
jgi:peptide/nickel transport system permease protein/oligopeptide transport system permease protein